MTTAGTTIDWCEDNYVVLPQVAEFYNTATSLFCMIPPMWFFSQRVPEGSGGIPWLHLLVSLIMAGSAAFHGTLTWLGQLLDEIPILILISATFFSMVDSLSIVGFSKQDPLVPRRSWWAPGPKLLTIISIAQVLFIAYVYIFEQKKYALFLGCAVGQAIGHWPLLLIEMFGRMRPVRKWLFNMLLLHVGLGYSGYGLWCIEHAFCDHVKFVNLHAWWHIMATFAMKPFLDLLIFQRLQALGRRPVYQPTLCGFGPSIVCEAGGRQD